MTDRQCSRALDLFRQGLDTDSARAIATSEHQTLGPPQANPFTCGGSPTSQGAVVGTATAPLNLTPQPGLNSLVTIEVATDGNAYLQAPS